MWYIYILRCNDGSFYTGISSDIQKGLLVHNRGKGSKYTRSKRPVELIYAEETDTKSQAKKRELEVKALSRENKKKLIKFGKGRRFPSAHEI
ncbi:MAG: GIY-YIG nuclease family protein [Candidatus Omnitrophica bacterium]|nr:GIY-YIG nuclease family protein [Candidatus Omnitrophota bacterium]